VRAFARVFLQRRAKARTPNLSAATFSDGFLEFPSSPLPKLSLPLPEKSFFKPKKSFPRLIFSSALPIFSFPRPIFSFPLPEKSFPRQGGRFFWL